MKIIVDICVQHGGPEALRRAVCQWQLRLVTGSPTHSVGRGAD